VWIVQGREPLIADVSSNMRDDFESFVGVALRRVEKKDYSWFFTFGDRLAIGTESSWRLVTPDGVAVTSEDHEQKFGLPAPVDAAERVMARLASHRVQAVSLDATTGDMHVSFAESMYLHFIQMSCGYESWRATTPRGESICLGGGRISFFPVSQES
jgi:hypothetical protein